MKKIIFVLSACVALLPLSAKADSGLLKPAGSWMVGPTALEDDDADKDGMPCVMTNEFSHDFALRISGGGEAIMAMALTVGQATFEKDESYLMTVGFAPGKGFQVPAEAFSEDTVVIGRDPDKGFYQSLKKSDVMYVTLGDSELKFSLKGAAQGLKQMEECYQPVAKAAVAVPPVVVPPPQDATGIHRLSDKESEIGKPSHQETGNALPPMEPVTEDMKVTSAEVEEEILAALPKPEPKPAPAPVKDVTPRDILTSPASGETPQIHWRVIKGSDLQDVLEVWAEGAKVKLIWAADESFSVQESLSMQATFEEVTALLLGQFPKDDAYPAGRFYLDPDTRHKVLVIEDVQPERPATAEGNYEPIITPN